MKKLCLLWLLSLICLSHALAQNQGDQNYDFKVDNVYYHILVDDSGNFIYDSSGWPSVEVTYLAYDYEEGIDISGGHPNLTAYVDDITIPVRVTDDSNAEHRSGISATNTTFHVTAIGERAFTNCSDLLSVTFAANSKVTSIGDRAFADCLSLETITLPEGVISIGSAAFYSSGLKSVELPSTLETILDNAFFYCTSLEKVTMPSARKIGSYAFGVLENLKEITIPENCSHLSELAFYGTNLDVLNFNAENCSFEGPVFSLGSVDTINVGEDVKSLFNYLSYNSSIKTVNYNAKNCEDVVLYNGYDAGPFGTDVTTINIGEGVETIPASLFYNCSKLSSITIPSGVESIGEQAFSGCTSLTTVTYNAANCADTELYEGNAVFQGCTALTMVNIGSDVQTIPAYLFYGCTNLATITFAIPSSVTSIADRAFWYCSGLEEVVIPDNVTTLGNSFYQCTGLKNVTIGKGVTYIEGDAFGYCTALESFTFNAVNCSSQSKIFNYTTGPVTANIGEDVTKIPDHLFNGCTALETLTMNSEVLETVGSYAFYNCNELAGTLTMPSTLTSIGENAFYGCSSLEEIDLEDTGITEILSSTFSECSSLKSITIPASVESIGDMVFYHCTSLKTVNYNAVNCSDTKLYVGNAVFQGCTALTTVNIGSEVQTIPAYLFYGCSALTTIVTVSDNSQLTSIGERAFSGCSGLSSITIPSGVESIGASAFYDCSNITTVTYNAKKCEDFSSSSSSRPFYSAQSTITNVIIGEEVEYIPAYLFYGCTALETLTMNSEVLETVGSYAFYNCNELAGTLTMPSPLTSIGSYAFYGCSTLEEINLENTALTEIQAFAFGNCYKLSSITIPSGVESIGNCAFYYCTSLETVNYNAVNCADTEPESGNSVFSGCTALATVNIGSDVQIIPAHLFQKCSAITSIEIPASVTIIGDYAFYNCSDLASVYYPSTTPAECGTNVFQEISSSRVLYVPYGSESRYSGYDGDTYSWKYFTVKAGWLPIDVDNLDDDGVHYYSTYYNGQYAYTMPDGVKGAAISVDGDKFKMNWMYPSGSTVPKGTPLLLQSTEELEDDLAVVPSDGTGSEPDVNYLYGSDEAEYSFAMVDGEKTYDGYHFYVLTTDTDGENLGFYYGITSGGKFKVTPNKAWMAVSYADEAKITSFTLSDSIDSDDSTTGVDGDDNETTGIASIESTGVSETANGVIYNMAGQRVNDTNHRGIYIVNGKKVVKN